jgi:hypothetical protein
VATHSLAKQFLVKLVWLEAIGERDSRLYSIHDFLISIFNMTCAE